MIRAATLEADFYEEVEAEPRSIAQATLVVLLAAAAGGLGSWLAELSVQRVVLDVVEPLILWVGCSVFSYMVGATFFRGPETGKSSERERNIQCDRPLADEPG